MRNKFFLLCGMLAPVVYVGAVIVRGVKRPGYSHRSHFVCDLLEAGAPNKSSLNPLFALYNLLTIACGIRLFAKVRGMSKDIANALIIPLFAIVYFLR